MKRLGLLLGILFATATAYAGFEAYNGTTSLNIFDKIQCSTGITCTRSNGKLVMVSSPTITSGTFTVAGAEATDGILTIAADESDDSGDDWAIKSVASGNALTFSNDTSGSQVVKLSMSTAGVLTLADSETITDASDVVTIASDDNDANLTLTGFEAKDAKLVFKADESDDNGDDWEIKAAASGNALTISNDTSGSQAAKFTLSTAGALSSVVSITGTGAGTLSGYLRAQVASTTTSITAAQCGSTFVSNSADVMALPEASTVLGCRLTFICGTADDFDINPDDADIIGPVNSVAAGTGAAITPSAGDAIRCTDIGSSIVLEAIAADRWAAVGVGNGAWSDVN